MPKPLTVVNDKVLALALANQFLVLLVRHLLKDGIVLLLDLRRERDWSFAHTKELAANSRGQGRRARKPHGAGSARTDSNSKQQRHAPNKAPPATTALLREPCLGPPVPHKHFSPGPRWGRAGLAASRVQGAGHGLAGSPDDSPCGHAHIQEPRPAGAATRSRKLLQRLGLRGLGDLGAAGLVHWQWPSRCRRPISNPALRLCPRGE